jgi:hypothetical protein
MQDFTQFDCARTHAVDKPETEAAGDVNAQAGPRDAPTDIWKRAKQLQGPVDVLCKKVGGSRVQWTKVIVL